jgi:hypothetical protein
VTDAFEDEALTIGHPPRDGMTSSCRETVEEINVRRDDENRADG